LAIMSQVLRRLIMLVPGLWTIFIRRECISEMLNAARDAGIDLCEFYPTAQDKSIIQYKASRTKLVIASLAQLKKRRASYVIDWYVGKKENLPAEVIEIGRARNPHYHHYAEKYIQIRAELDAELRPKAEEIYQQLVQQWQVRFDEWASVSIAEWEKMDHDCSSCYGGGVIPSMTGGADYYCDSCGGRGYFTTEELREQHKPVKPTFKFSVDEDLFRKHCKERGIEIYPEWEWVYIRFVEQSG
jgi:hypothetical protein